MTWETLALWALGALLVVLGGALLSFGWMLGRWWFHYLFGHESPRTQVVINNHPPPGHYQMSTPEGFAILPLRPTGEEEPS